MGCQASTRKNDDANIATTPESSKKQLLQTTQKAPAVPSRTVVDCAVQTSPVHPRTLRSSSWRAFRASVLTSSRSSCKTRTQTLSMTHSPHHRLFMSPQLMDANSLLSFWSGSAASCSFPSSASPCSAAATHAALTNNTIVPSPPPTATTPARAVYSVTPCPPSAIIATSSSSSPEIMPPTYDNTVKTAAASGEGNAAVAFCSSPLRSTTPTPALRFCGHSANASPSPSSTTSCSVVCTPPPPTSCTDDIMMSVDFAEDEEGVVPFTPTSSMIALAPATPFSPPILADTSSLPSTPLGTAAREDNNNTNNNNNKSFVCSISDSVLSSSGGLVSMEGTSASDESSFAALLHPDDVDYLSIADSGCERPGSVPPCTPVLLECECGCARDCDCECADAAARAHTLDVTSLLRKLHQLEREGRGHHHQTAFEDRSGSPKPHEQRQTHLSANAAAGAANRPVRKLGPAQRVPVAAPAAVSHSHSQDQNRDPNANFFPKSSAKINSTTSATTTTSATSAAAPTAASGRAPLGDVTNTNIMNVSSASDVHHYYNQSPLQSPKTPLHSLIQKQAVVHVPAAQHPAAPNCNRTESGAASASVSPVSALMRAVKEKWCGTPEWASGSKICEAVNFSSNPPNPYEIFTSAPTTCDLGAIFSPSERCMRRTSTGDWSQDAVTLHEEQEYARAMGFGPTFAPHAGRSAAPLLPSTPHYYYD
eukprot:gnl/Spiro4/11116_TR5895_c0_g1_i1.p1 gnl/Spiro4/11116_TR5895_c0_g1~~gnl/Spiro4/11116_TR5895_c0_g1_i1.p1  ORF type:complete len:708 (+),score=165.46 gnl/Spiro4/11116_TR5895_c0_g1_i1:73-2196(+)